MKTRNKALLLALCALLLVVTTVFATLAYLTSETKTVTNTFTIGNIEITLDETDVDEYGVAIEDADPVQANEYKLIPGHEYIKDPTIHVSADSEASYLFAVVKNDVAEIEAAENSIDAQILANSWSPMVDQEFNDAGYKIYYKEAAAGAADYVLFSTLTIADDADVADYNGQNIIVKACAIQKDGITDVGVAFDELKAKFEII